MHTQETIRSPRKTINFSSGPHVTHLNSNNRAVVQYNTAYQQDIWKWTKQYILSWKEDFVGIRKEEPASCDVMHEDNKLIGSKQRCSQQQDTLIDNGIKTYAQLLQEM